MAAAVDAAADAPRLDGFVPWPARYARAYRQAGLWTGETIGSLLRSRALAPDTAARVALVDESSRLTYAGLDERVDRLAAGLHRLGLRARDRVVLQLPNGAAFVETFFALVRLGVLPILAHPGHRAAEITAFAAQTDAVAYFIPGKTDGFDYETLAVAVTAACPHVRHVIVAGSSTRFAALHAIGEAPQDFPAPSPDDVALFQLSGGSTGTPKLIPRTHDDYLCSVRASAAVCRLDAGSAYLCALPVGHNFPLSSPGVLGTLWAGGKVVMARHASCDVAFPLIAAEAITIAALVPPLAMVWAQAAAGHEAALRSLRVLQVGGAKLSCEQARLIKQRLGCQLQQVYGMAEGLVCYTRLDDPDDVVLHTQGRPMCAADELRVIDEEGHDLPHGEVGHLITRGPYTVRGYYKSAEHDTQAFTPDGFYRTGDVVRITPAGNVVVEGRSKDQINKGGEKIAAAEVERHLVAHDQVAEAALVAMPDEYLGERICAFVVARDSALDRRTLVAFLKERGLATYKIPDRWEMVTALPRTSVGKVSKQDLRRWLATGGAPADVRMHKEIR